MNLPSLNKIKSPYTNPIKEVKPIRCLRQKVPQQISVMEKKIKALPSWEEKMIEFNIIEV